MGIGTQIASKVGIPLAIAVGAALILAKFKDPILGALESGAQTIGGAISSPISGVLTGFQSGLSNIPKTIDIPFPTFQFSLGGGVPASKTNDSGFDPLQNLCENSLGALCFDGRTPTKQGSNDAGNEAGSISPPPPSVADGGIKNDAETAPVFKVQLSQYNEPKFLTFEGINELFGFGANDPVVGIIDYKNTEFRERVPVTKSGLNKYSPEAIYFLGSVSENSQIGSGLALDPNKV